LRKEKGDQPQWESTWQAYVVSAAGGLCFVGQIVLCFTSYNRLNLDRVLYLGWTVLAVALLIGMSARRALEEQVDTSERENLLGTQAVVERGMYGVVRHPIYLSFLLVILSLILISQHWLSAILGLPWMAYLYLSMLGEEQINIESFGDAYRQYMRDVPRANLVLGAIRHWRRRRARADQKPA
jgi:protein-S-isoprenylcysteine O-methyltransferase Ste14